MHFWEPALNHSSALANPGKPNSFEIVGVHFGWETIEGMLQREIKRRQNGELPRVENLRESHVYPTSMDAS